VLRRADVPVAAQVLGIEVPEWVRSAADEPGLHRPWTAAVVIGLLSIDGNRAVSGPVLAGWRSATDDEVLDRWSRAFAGGLASTFDDDGDGSESLEIGRLVSTVLAVDPALTGADLVKAIGDTILRSSLPLYRIFDRGFGHRDPAEVALDLLAAFGATDQRRITPLGRWALLVINAHGESLLGALPTGCVVDGICQLKITLRYVRPACWRRILVPASATLGDLHEIIQIAFAWNDDHLHGFTVGRRRYGDPGFDFEYDEDKITLAEVFARVRKPISYIYDFGDNWEHEIAFEKTVDPDAGTIFPSCMDGRGGAPVEDWGEEEPAWIPFDQADINTRLARSANRDRHVESQLDEDIQVILTDAYGEAEEMTAFLTVLEEEIPFPAPATLLGNPVIVTGLTEDDATLELRARCKGKHGRGKISFADLEFRAGTVEAWLHAAYLTHLGRRPSDVTLPAGWAGLTRWVS
jgi:hypothetical protein